MPTPRAHQINLDAATYYHCYVRCVRKGYLFGTGENGRNYDHRKDWISNRIHHLTQAFAIEICSYAVMSNHYHIVLHVNKDQAMAWSDEEVNERWKIALSRKTDLPLASPEEMARRRNNLFSISWFMRFLNEHIARCANKEDEVTGRFWEGRFQSQALLDEGALLACMAYVDLNPIRAKMAKTLQESDHTSIQERLAAHENHQPTPETLMPFQEESQKENSFKVTLPFSQKDYFSLIDWSGHQFREGKSGYIASEVPSIVQSVGLNPAHWINTIEQSRTRDQSISGALSLMKAWADRIRKKWLKGQKITQIKYLTT
jgi:REP element-mobilizing transposase RayT